MDTCLADMSGPESFMASCLPLTASLCPQGHKGGCWWPLVPGQTVPMESSKVENPCLS
jgi:hypothetical protein